MVERRWTEDLRQEEVGRNISLKQLGVRKEERVYLNLGKSIVDMRWFDNSIPA